MANLVDVDIGGTEFANSTLHITGGATLNGVKANTIASSGGAVTAMKIDDAGILKESIAFFDHIRKPFTDCYDNCVLPSQKSPRGHGIEGSYRQRPLIGFPPVASRRQDKRA